MEKEEKLVLLHSNDMHGDFLAETKGSKQVGGVSLLSGYIKKTRAENPNTLFAIAGDMFRGSIIDSEYRGFSTIELMNFLSPDVVTVGNHEVDYGLAHLLFLEKCAKFPIVNANMYIKTNHTRLFQPYKIIDVNGIKVLFIGVITEEVLASTRSEEVIGTFVDVWEAAKQVGTIVDNYKTTRIDLTVLLTHIGFEEDKKLAALLDPQWGVDLIIGGHSHTLLNKPFVVNGVPIVQVGCGTDQVGRFDITIDTENHRMKDYAWSVIPVTDENCPVDNILEEVLQSYKSETDRKYLKILTTLERELTHPSRAQETELGNLFADIMQVDSSFDVMLFGSGSIRKKKFGPIVTLQDLQECVPFDGPITMLEVTGKQFRQMVAFFLEQSVTTKGSSEFYQVSKGVKAVYNYFEKRLETCSLHGKEIKDGDRIKIALQEYHYKNFTEFFSVPLEEVLANMKPRVVVTSETSIFEEYLVTSNHLDAHVEGRLIIKKEDPKTARKKEQKLV
ncbi:MAG: 5'-nucleotidase C-terminal domain-containing protein [Erysipelotrichales bacterium]|nr:5'-nucleotidase C-terminal domain-containing protein [Erysipelotrichales bacterium]MBQ4011770.1 5'-nucleotidase C-terminal domain-containing protein [Erysipelotrichales bacterium]